MNNAAGLLPIMNNAAGLVLIMNSAPLAHNMNSAGGIAHIVNSAAGLAHILNSAAMSILQCWYIRVQCRNTIELHALPGLDICSDSACSLYF
jgi:hypothetical protein